MLNCDKLFFTTFINLYLDDGLYFQNMVLLMFLFIGLVAVMKTFFSFNRLLIQPKEAYVSITLQCAYNYTMLYLCNCCDATSCSSNTAT